MSDPTALLAELKRRGIEIRVDGTRLRYRPVDRVSPELLIQLRIRKAELMKILQDEIPSWDNPQNPVVRAAREKARRLGVLDDLFPANPTLVGARWVEGDDLDPLSEQLQGLCTRREGWTAPRWAEYLRHRANLCDDEHRDVAKMYERAATLLCRANEGNAD